MHNATGTAVAAAAAPQHLRPTRVRTLVVEAVTDMLGAEVLPDEPLIAAGLDSLGAVELRNVLQARMPPGIELPATLLFDHPSVEALTSFITSQARLICFCVL